MLTLFRNGNIRGQEEVKGMRFTGRTLALSDLGRLSRKAKASWDYFGFDPRERYGWSALLSGSEAVIVTDESHDLNTSTIFPDMDEFINWLEEIYA